MPANATNVNVLATLKGLGAGIGATAQSDAYRFKRLLRLGAEILRS